MSPENTRLSSGTIRKLKQIFGKENVSTDETDKISYSKDMLPAGLLAIRRLEPPPPPDVIVWAHKTEQICELLQLANSQGFPVIPYGAGSGVCGGTFPLSGGVILDMKRMDKIIELDDNSLTAKIQAGIVGQILEMELNRRGYTLGHFPSSIYCSTLGGWLVTRSAGQLSTKYGKIEDMVMGLQVVLPSGQVIATKAVPRSATGPNLTQLFVGSEGLLGVVTEAIMRICPYPQAIRYCAYLFPDVPSGCEAIRLILRSGAKPAVVRLYDELDTMLVGSGKADDEGDSLIKRLIGSYIKENVPAGVLKAVVNHFTVVEKLSKALKAQCLLILGMEGSEELVEAESSIVQRVCKEAGGKDLGEKPGLNWEKSRYNVSYRMSTVFDSGAFVDTIEVAITWDRLTELYFAVREALVPHCFIMAHFSHAYPEGCSIYFTFVGAADDDKQSEKKYFEIWDKALNAVLSVGGTISHHHGIGWLKGKYMPAEHGDAFEVLRAIKSTLDPNNILNPGKLGL